MKWSCKNCRGQALVEFALVLPLFLMILFGLLQFGLAFSNYLTLNAAAREGARTAAITADVDTIKNRAREAASTVPGLETPVITYEDGTRTVGKGVTVTLHAPVPILLPYVNTFLTGKLEGKVVMRVEQL